MFGFKKSSNATKIVSVSSEESDIPTVAARESQSTADATSQSSLEIDKEQLRLNLQTQHTVLADKACDLVRQLCTDDNWILWEHKGATKTEKNESALGRVAGRATHTWTASQYGLDAIEEFLWDNEAKNQYDEFSAAMILMAQYEGDYHVVDQIFRSRFGIAGRDFMVAVHKRREDDEDFERLVIGVQSIPPEDEPHIELLLEYEAGEKYYKMKQKVVRGTVFAAGYYVTKNKKTNEISLTYVNDADVRSRGVPQWIVTRVKLDQLKIVKNIPGCIEGFLRKQKESAR